MRAAIAVAAFAAGALAVPHKRDMYTDINVVYVTDIVTVTYGGQEPSATPKADHYGHHSHASSSTVESTTVIEPTPTAYEQPETSTYATPTSTSEAPESTSKASSSTTATQAAPTDYNGIVLYHHNIHRFNHSSPDLVWSDDLASSAAKIASSCVYAHNTEVDGGGYGQNIAAGVEANNISAIITDLFYNGEEPYYASNYGLADPDMSDFDSWGHFSQIVWNGTTEVACATQHCPNGLANVGSDVSPYFTVCNYKTPGNYAGEYAANINKPKGDPTASWNTGLSPSSY